MVREEPRLEFPVRGWGLGSEVEFLPRIQHFLDFCNHSFPLITKNSILKIHKKGKGSLKRSGMSMKGVFWNLKIGLLFELGSLTAWTFSQPERKETRHASWTFLCGLLRLHFSLECCPQKVRFLVPMSGMSVWSSCSISVCVHIRSILSTL